MEAFGSSMGIVRNIGGWGHAAGPARFIVQCMFTGTATATLLGGVVSMVSAYCFDAAALPFAIATSIGFMLGSLNSYYRSVRRALVDLELYPRVLRFHLARHFPFQRYQERPIEWFAARNFRGWQEESRLIVGWVSSQDDLDEIRVRRSLALVESESERDISK